MILYNLMFEINQINKKVIGLFKIDSKMYLVLSIEDDLVHCFSFSNISVIHELHIDISKGKYVPVPSEYDSFYDLLQNRSIYMNWHFNNFYF